MDIKKIIVPVDGSDAANHAFAYGLELTQKYNAELFLIYVADVSEAAYPVMQVTLDRSGLAAVKDRAEKILGEMKAKVPVGTKLTAMVKIGIPGNIITNLVAENNIDLVIMGNSGKGSLSSFIMGSVSHYVIHHVTCPVLIVK